MLQPTILLLLLLLISLILAFELFNDVFWGTFLDESFENDSEDEEMLLNDSSVVLTVTVDLSQAGMLFLDEDDDGHR